MDLKEILREAGIEDKVIKSILTSMKAEKIYTTSEENVDAISKALYQFCIDNMDIDFAEEEEPETEDKNQVGFIK